MYTPVDSIPFATIMKGSFKFTPATVTIFATAFLATDYVFYRQNYKYVNSLVWKRVLGQPNM